MIDMAAEAGVSAAKFQFHVLEDEMLKDTPISKFFRKSLRYFEKNQLNN